MRALFVAILAVVSGCTWITDTELDARADLDGDGTPGGQDCDDRDPDHQDLVDWYADADGDGFGDAMTAKGFCQPPTDAAWSDDPSDCNDADADVHPDAREVCNDVDDDCDELFDDSDPDLDGNTGSVFYPDGDGDSVAREAPTEAIAACLPPSGFVMPPAISLGEDWDCDDGDPGVFPGAQEVCNDATDNDCDGLVDEEGPGQEAYLEDRDQDGFPPAKALVQELCAVVDGWVLQTTAPTQPDCDDTDPAVNPGALEIWYDGTDQDCDGNDLDRDFDGSDYLDDCDDDDPTISPLLPEVWYDGIDQDCDGADDFDQDGDLWRLADDCDDVDPTVNPAATETWYDGVDTSCHGRSDFDQDGDGEDSEAEIGGPDCSDFDPLIFSTAAEIWYDGVDQDCDGADDFDQDADGYPIGTGSDDGIGPSIIPDCDDGDPAVNPEATEVCADLVDNDCDGAVDDFGTGGTTQYRDADFDGYPADVGSQLVCNPPVAGWVSLAPGPGTTDCNDTLATLNPGAIEEWYDGVDQNCDGNDDDQDLDGDPKLGFSGGQDCNDVDPDIHSTAPEFCDTVDQDCDGIAYPPTESVSGVLPDGSLADVRGLVGSAFDASAYAVINFCSGTFAVEILYDPGNDLVLQGYNAAALEPVGSSLVAPLALPLTTSGRLTLSDLSVEGPENGNGSPMFVATAVTSMVANRVSVHRSDRTVFDAEPGSTLTLVDLELLTGTSPDPLVRCDDCALDVQGGLFDGFDAVGFEISGIVADATLFATIAQNLGDSFLVVEGGALAVLDEVTVLDGQANVGPAIHVRTGGLVDIDNGYLDGNTAVTAGGAVYVEDATSSFFVRHTTFNDNSAPRGGAIGVLHGTVQLLDATLTSNDADSGGGVGVEEGLLFSQNSVFQNNTSTFDGGAILIDDGTWVSATDRVIGNSAGLDGGGVWLSGNSGVASLAGAYVDGNGSGSSGGGLGVTGRAVLFLSANSTVTNNGAASGGGVYLDTLGTFGSVNTEWGGNAPDDFQNQSWTPATAPEVILCASGLPCLML